MADLRELAKLKGITVPTKPTEKKAEEPQFRKRRPWLEGEDTEKTEERSENIATNAEKRSEEPSEIVVESQQERSKNAAAENPAKKERSEERSDKHGRTKLKRSEERSENAATDLIASPVDPNLLVGTQRAVFKYLFELCREYASLVTPELNLETMAEATGLGNGQIHGATKELRKKRCITLASRKDGRSGWVQYAIAQDAYDKWLRRQMLHQRAGNAARSQQERSEQHGENAATNPVISISSSSFLEGENNSNVFDLEASEVANLKAIGFGKGHLSQVQEIVAAGQVSHADAIASLKDYAFDAAEGKVQSVNLLFSELRKQRPYHSARRAQVLKEELNRIRQANEEARAMTAELQQAREALVFNAWLKTLSEEQKKEILQRHPFNLPVEQILRAEFYRIQGS